MKNCNKFVILILSVLGLSVANAQAPFSGPFNRGAQQQYGKTINNFGNLCFDNGTYAIVPIPALNRVILGGNFTQVGSCMGSGVPVDSSTGLAVSGFNRDSMIEGASVSAAIPDGSGGWYVGGNFFIASSRFALPSPASNSFSGRMLQSTNISGKKSSSEFSG